MKNKVILIIAILCVVIIGYLLSMKKNAAPVAVPSPISGLPTTTPTAENNAPTSAPAPATEQVPVQAMVGAREEDGVPAGAPVAPADSVAPAGAMVGAPVEPTPPAGVPAPAAGAGMMAPEAPVGTPPLAPPGTAPAAPAAMAPAPAPAAAQ